MVPITYIHIRPEKAKKESSKHRVKHGFLVQLPVDQGLWIVSV